MHPKYHMSYSDVISSSVHTLAQCKYCCWLSVKFKNSGTLSVLATLKDTTETKEQSVVNARAKSVIDCPLIAKSANGHGFF